MRRNPAMALAVFVLLGGAGQPAQAFQQATGASEAAGRQAQSVRDAAIVRGLWVTRWEYSTAGDVAAVMSQAAEWGMTDVFFQVRGRADALYRSSLEPWASDLTGQLGQDPGWDPLEAALREARSRGLRLHAWINTFPMWSGRTPPTYSEPEHVLRTNPEWIMADRSGLTQRLGNRFGYISAAPGNPEVQQHIQAVVLDIVSKYPVDGIHFDYIRLPDHDYSYDAVSRARFLRETTRETYMEWQIDQVTGMLRRIAREARAIRPQLIMTAAVVNRYERGTGIFAQDAARWVEDGVLDYVIAMAYTPSVLEFSDMLETYTAVMPPERLAAGINVEEMPGDPAAVGDEVSASLRTGGRGHVFFSMAPLRQLVAISGEGPDLYGLLERRASRPLVAGDSPGAPTPGAQTPNPTERDVAPQATLADVRSLLRYLVPAVAGLILFAFIFIP